MTLSLKGVGKNISAGGVCFAVPQPYEPGDLLSLQVNFTGWQRHKSSYAAVIDDDLAMAPLTAVVKVAWCQAKADTHDYEIGATFENIYEDDFKALKEVSLPIVIIRPFLFFSSRTEICRTTLCRNSLP
jgi:hypothetical protein